ncbi:MAG: hypothetical protein A3I07_02790 [Candidatus Doudnabacteria bacterium RIFCSPLOWO2_02_FULL_42_9]|uniref:Transcriptional repressor PaaX-like central Cas2-like domain-containing protein n=1 Tax=Candidatus Doudnabacteria bacterium RIFCSPHIGHO2_01_FULL_41_86 TaxID=1817821 RepID=A0A1F5N9H4_9BACT|nr:MAG: hypothetical protein A2717_02315 [Candidatus Doudnabacteria bacterium RIFCSPHIGHO2_01_FULL_41_86]OGE75594.1 MAG: hypothetical protein A3K07_02070 [Candidatus Doudnabacteria bacterium RIFCSPHIGHO2_01_43_10]OGE85390.1 MAG: hypothetical protein A3E28_01885 [Candidatus Doudnabacteria bacterium RIFCSPHIGHO2_12_FULL_42_22]OGE86928.1 MAG: hypothetical protein A3C49_02720 [Candidatus Doudnabacteria bacterium RIFCSPHIGHO2_02_FULL_42_25]OGE92527.1 MAG: hypothetical protein A2895_02875 [Candidatus
MRIKQDINISQLIRKSTASKKPKLSDQQVAMLKTAAEVVLATGILAGTVAIAVIAPNLLSALGKIQRYGYSGYDRKQRFEKRQKDIVKSFYYLKRYGYIQLMREGEDYVMKITKKGEDKVRRLNFENLTIPQTSRLRKHWWFVLADIPSNPYRRRADLFREKLKLMNFYPLQRTVWVYPYKPTDQIEFVAVYYEIENFVTVAEAAKLDADDEEKLNQFFKDKSII